MQSVRVQLASQGDMFIDVVCDCGSNGLTNKLTGEASFKHLIERDPSETMVLVCHACKSEYAILAQGDHIHIVNKFGSCGPPILFYEGTGYVYSNFSSFKVRWRDVDWMTSEHAYQAAKFDDRKIIDQIKEAPSAHDAMKIAHCYRDKQVHNSPEMKISIMEEVVRAKSAQHPYIQKKLLESGDREIVENSPTDSFWGRGPDWKGQNWLGRIWMNLRAEMRMTPIS